MIASQDTRTTAMTDGSSATWYVDNGVIFVVRVHYSGGKSTHLGLELGRCFDLMPRRLWDQILYVFERDR